MTTNHGMWLICQCQLCQCSKRVLKSSSLTKLLHVVTEVKLSPEAPPPSMVVGLTEERPRRLGVAVGVPDCPDWPSHSRGVVCGESRLEEE